jgi:hypothetical protein
MRLGGLAAAALLLAPIALAASGAPLSTEAVRHAEAGWASLALEASGFTASLRVKNMSGPLVGAGILAYDAQGRHVGGEVYAVDAYDMYSTSGAFNYEWSLQPDGGGLTTLRYVCDPCPEVRALAFWYAGESAWWEHAVATTGDVGASDSGSEVFALRNDDFGGATEPTFELAYLIPGTTTTLHASNGLVGGFPRWSLYWDDDMYGADARDLRVHAPDGSTLACGPADLACYLGDPRGAGDYALEVLAAGAGIAYSHLIFTGADVRLPE